MNNATLVRSYVADTVALVLRIEQRQLGTHAQATFAAMEAGASNIFVPGMVFAEILYLRERNRISASLQDVSAYMQQHPHCQEYPLSQTVVDAAVEIQDIPELHDRLIAATARLLNVALITNDHKIQESQFVQTVW
jgi:predicted nucleic acid-binding protein